MREFLKLFFKALLEEKRKNKSLKNSPVVSLYVKKKMDYKRYEIYIKDKKIICISHKELQTDKNYWGIIQKDSFEIITLSNLYLQPKPFQALHFIPFEMIFKEIPDIISSEKYKQMYIDLLQKQKNIEQNSYIYCLQKKIVTFPLYLFDEIMLLQFDLTQDTKFYFAFKNLGAFEGVISKNSIYIKYLYDSIQFPSIKELTLKKSSYIEPLCFTSSKLIDLTG